MLGLNFGANYFAPRRRIEDDICIAGQKLSFDNIPCKANLAAKQKGGAGRFRSFTRQGSLPAVGWPAIPHRRVFNSQIIIWTRIAKEALQVAKELTAKFIETRTVSPGNFAGNFSRRFPGCGRDNSRESGQSAIRKGRYVD